MSQAPPNVPDPSRAAEPKARSNRFLTWISAWSERHPVGAIVCMAVLSVAINCHPIIFLGKSFVSPVSTGDKLVYDWWPPLPGMEQWPGPTPEGYWPDRTLAIIHNMHGCDTGSTMWWGIPTSFLEWRCLWEHKELPLWNRYSHAGDTLIGQANYLVGDPLHWIVLTGHGTAWAWDLKYLTAKVLFCAGFGLLVLRLLKSVPLALIFTALAAYCGAYFYVFSHPSFFVLAYAPWILLTAIEWLDWQRGWRVRWGLIWLLANFGCFNAGHVEVGVVLIGGLNLAAMVYQSICHRSMAATAGILGRMAMGTLLFLGLTAPFWISFLFALNGAYSVHEKIAVRQLPLTSLPGAFDDLFYLASRPNYGSAALAPGSSLLIYAGCCLSWLRWRQQKSEPFFWVNTGAVILWGGCVFGWVPASLLMMVPLLNRVGHSCTDFSYLLVIHLTLQCAYGFKCLAQENNIRRTLANFAWIVGIGIAGVTVYCLKTTHQPIPWDYVACAGAAAVGAPLLFAYLNSRQRLTWAGWMGIIILGLIPNFRFGLYNSGDDTWLMVPGPRLTLNASSQAIDKIKAAKSDPFRVAGWVWNLMGDYAATYELEDIRSCAPLSSGEYINLISQFPGMQFTNDWMASITDPRQAQPLLNLLNVKYLLASPKISFGGKSDFRIADRSDFTVLENLEAWPRAFFASGVVAIDSTGEFFKYLVKHGREPFIALTTPEIAKQPGLQSLETAIPVPVSPAANYRLLPNATEFDVHASSAGMVCLTEGQARDFTALANNEPKRVLTVNRSFKGIYLDKPGDYHICFTYRPAHWRLACTVFWISASSVIILALAGFFCVNGAGKKPIGPAR